MVLCRNDDTISYFMNLKMAMLCLTSNSECQTVLSKYGKYMNLDYNL